MASKSKTMVIHDRKGSMVWKREGTRAIDETETKMLRRQTEEAAVGLELEI